MRISTSMQYYSGKQNLVTNQGDLYKLQNQLSTGKKVLTPSDDPVAATRALLVGQSKSKNEQYMSSQDIASGQLALTDSILGNAGDILQTLSEGAIQAGDGTYTDSERQTLAKDFQVRLDSLVDLANSKSASGDYLFGGYRSDQPPFTKISTTGSPTPYVQYNGDSGSLKLQVASTATVPVTEDGSNVFLRVTDKNGVQTNSSVFDSIQQMITYLQTPNAPVTAKASYDAGLSNIQASLEHVTRARTSVGAREQMVSALNQTSQDLDSQYTQNISALEDLDYTAAISDFTQQQTQLQAAQQTFTKVTQANLFSYM
ncbi:MAG: hypothetical protein RIR18_1266 [Pseudomonadota bacterium]|jgi:flagellar hook-associated protein 3 FlgL